MSGTDRSVRRSGAQQQSMKQSWADNLHALGSAVQQAMALHAQDSDGEIKEM